MGTEVSSLPWTAEECGDGACIIANDGDHVGHVNGNAANCESAMDRANLIVAAVNGYEPMRKALEAMVNERYSELDMMSCEYPRGSAEAIAWESGVRQAWRLWDLSKEPGVKALQQARAALAGR